MEPTVILRWASIYQGGVNLKKTIRRILRSERGEATYLSMMVYVLVVVILIALVLNIFSVISAKQQMDHAADQIVKQIQLAGGTNSDTDALFQYIGNEISGVQNLTYTVDAACLSRRPSGMYKAIQIGTPIYITVTGEAELGGFWNINAFHLNVVAKATGVSEKYWK